MLDLYLFYGCQVIAVYRYDINQFNHHDLNIITNKEIKMFSNEHMNRLELCTNAASEQLFNNS